jgi:molecular chaperone DnaJ
MSDTRLYDELGIDKSADTDAIKKAYKAMAMKYHPDKVGGGDSEKAAAEEKFKKVSEAYAVLSDSGKRANYDATGSVDEGSMPDINDLISKMFGGGGGGFGGFGGFGDMFGGGGRGESPTHCDILHCDITLDEVYNGVTKKIEYDVTSLCTNCDGRGAVDPADIIKCLTCKGRGVFAQQMGPMIFQSTCPACGGQCSTIRTNKACNGCKGNKYATYKKSIKIDLMPGMPDKYEYKVSGKGNYNRETKKNNDLIVVFSHVQKQNIKVDSTKGNITYDMTITIDDLLCGFKKNINIYGSPIEIFSDGYFNPTKPAVFKEKGMPIYKKNNKGDLKIKFTITYSDDEKINKYQDVFFKIFKRTKLTTEKPDCLRITS